jgi:hypothetical protein
MLAEWQQLNCVRHVYRLADGLDYQVDVVRFTDDFVDPLLGTRDVLHVRPMQFYFVASSGRKSLWTLIQPRFVKLSARWDF